MEFTGAGNYINLSCVNLQSFVSCGGFHSCVLITDQSKILIQHTMDGSEISLRTFLRQYPDFDINTVIDTRNGFTMLHWCAYLNHPNIARLLIENKINVNAVDKYGNTPLHICAGNTFLFCNL